MHLKIGRFALFTVISIKFGGHFYIVKFEWRIVRGRGYFRVAWRVVHTRTRRRSKRILNILSRYCRDRAGVLYFIPLPIHTLHLHLPITPYKYFLLHSSSALRVPVFCPLFSCAPFYSLISPIYIRHSYKCNYDRSVAPQMYLTTYFITQHVTITFISKKVLENYKINWKMHDKVK